MRYISKILIVFIMFYSLPGHAVYKCKDEKGAVTFSGIPCGSNAEIVTIRPKATNNTSNKKDFLTPQERADLRRYESRKPKRDSLDASLQKNDRDYYSESCKSAKMYQQDYKDELRTGCTASRCEQVKSNIKYWKRRVDRYCN